MAIYDDADVNPPRPTSLRGYQKAMPWLHDETQFDCGGCVIWLRLRRRQNRERARRFGIGYLSFRSGGRKSKSRITHRTTPPPCRCLPLPWRGRGSAAGSPGRYRSWQASCSRARSNRPCRRFSGLAAQRRCETSERRNRRFQAGIAAIRGRRNHGRRHRSLELGSPKPSRIIVWFMPVALTHRTIKAHLRADDLICLNP